jgi:hypothetical protein
MLIQEASEDIPKWRNSITSFKEENSEKTMKKAKTNQSAGTHPGCENQC